MQNIQASVVIDAPLADVWDVLIDGDSYSRWNPFITSVSGGLTRGARPTMRIEPVGGRGMTFRPRITHSSAEVGLRWIGHLGVPGLCDARHEFVLTPLPGGGTHVSQRETFRGLLVPLLRGMIEPTRQGFEAMNAALRQRVEASR